MAPRTKKTGPVAAVPEDDARMDDAPPAGQDGEDYSTIDRQMIRVLPGSSETAASFEFTGEDHTLGNALRYIIMKKGYTSHPSGRTVTYNCTASPDVEFCGYSIPHPSEPKMNVRIQTYEGTTAFDALEKGLDDLMDLCDVVADKFVEAKSNFANSS